MTCQHRWTMIGRFEGDPEPKQPCDHCGLPFEDRLRVDTPAPKKRPPADAPIRSAWVVFAALAMPTQFTPEQRRYLKHAFYAGARSAFASVVDSMEEQAEGDERGQERFSSIELEIARYFESVTAITPADMQGPKLIQP